MIVVAVVVWLIDKRRMSPQPLLAAYILFILMETVIGRKAGALRMELVPFWSYSHPEHRVEIILNYVLFIPFGFLLSGIKKKDGVEMSTGKVVLIGLLFSTSIELIQLLFKIGVFEFDDIIGNTIGCFIGAAVGKMCGRKHANK